MISPAIRERYPRDPLSIRLGGLAADLARVASFSENPLNHDAVTSLLEEGKYFAEWTAPDAPLEIQEKLAAVQLQLSLWQRRWIAGSPAPRMQQKAQRWADELLKCSGLTD